MTKLFAVSRSFGFVAAVVVGCVALSGCGSGSSGTATSTTEQMMKVSGKEELKKRLMSVAETGAGGSGLAGIREAITALKSTDAAIADQLLLDLDQLEMLSDPAQIKEIAGKMAASL